MVQRGSAPQAEPPFLNPEERLSLSQAALHASQPPVFTGGPRRRPAKLWVPVRRDGEFSSSGWVQRSWTFSRTTNCFPQGKPDRLGEELHESTALGNTRQLGQVVLHPEIPEDERFGDVTYNNRMRQNHGEVSEPGKKMGAPYSTLDPCSLQRVRKRENRSHGMCPSTWMKGWPIWKDA